MTSIDDGYGKEKSNRKVVLVIPISNRQMLVEEFQEVIVREDVLVKVVTDEVFENFYL